MEAKIRKIQELKKEKKCSDHGTLLCTGRGTGYR